MPAVADKCNASLVLAKFCTNNLRRNSFRKMTVRQLNKAYYSSYFKLQELESKKQILQSLRLKAKASLARKTTVG